MIDYKYERTSHYWKKGYLGRGCQAFLDAVELTEESELSEDAKYDEKQKILDSRKDTFRENFKYFPPWDK